MGATLTLRSKPFISIAIVPTSHQDICVNSAGFIGCQRYQLQVRTTHIYRMLTPATDSFQVAAASGNFIQRARKLKSPILALPLDIATLRHRLRRSATDEFTATRLTRGKEPVIPGKALAGEVQIGAVGWPFVVFVVRPSRNDARAVGWRATAKLARDRRAAAVGADDESRPQRPIPVLRCCS
jgi:hypothetical protein